MALIHKKTLLFSVLINEPKPLLTSKCGFYIKKRKMYLYQVIAIERSSIKKVIHIVPNLETIHS